LEARKYGLVETKVTGYRLHVTDQSKAYAKIKKMKPYYKISIGAKVVLFSPATCL